MTESAFKTALMATALAFIGLFSIVVIPAFLENPDIIAQAGQAKRSGQLIIGFAAETHDLVDNAQAKLSRKNLDLIADAKGIQL